MTSQMRAVLERMTIFPFEVDGETLTDIPETAKTVVFRKRGNAPEEKELKVTFKPYFVTGFDRFDFHEKFNKGIYPPTTVMYGYIIKETEKMYYVALHTEMNDKTWDGWVPKKSCVVQ